MHTLRFLGLIAALVAGQPAPTPSAQPSTAAPVAVVANPSVDLGEAREGVTAVATFVIENHGTSDLIIEDVKPSCGCTTVELGEDERVIPPGGKRDIVARLDTTNRLGRQVKPITVKLNDPRSPEIKLTLTVNVVTLFQVLPAPIIQLRSVQRGRELTPLEVFPQHPNEVFTKLDIEVPKDLLDYRVESIENPERGKGKRYTFTVPDDAELGTVNDTIRIH
ncbi:MAG TPA: DUF1573 domain-containing protein, partial [Phycisphaerae bacterium]|nr:DUF1573 domain-containing protein [Phycisphaerae bacterium]